MNAADRLRQAIEAVRARTYDNGGWYARAGEVRTIAEDTQGSGSERGWLVIETYDREHDQPVADYIALMDPTVGAALADLLDAHADAKRAEDAWLRDANDIDEFTTAQARLEDAFDALEQAIERSQT